MTILRAGFLNQCNRISSQIRVLSKAEYASSVLTNIFNDTDRALIVCRWMWYDTIAITIRKMKRFYVLQSRFPGMQEVVSVIQELSIPQKTDLQEVFLLSLETTLVGVGFLILGYMLRVNRWTGLLAGFEDSATISKEAVAETTGEFLLWVGAATIAFGFVVDQFRTDFGLYGPIFSLVVVLGFCWLTYEVNTDSRNGSTVEIPYGSDS